MPSALDKPPAPAPAPPRPIAAEQPAPRAASSTTSAVIADELPKPRYESGAKKTDEAKSDASRAKVRSHSNPRPSSVTAVPSLLNRNADASHKDIQGSTPLSGANQDKAIASSRLSPLGGREEDLDKAPGKGVAVAVRLSEDKERQFKYNGEHEGRVNRSEPEEKRRLDVEDIISRLDLNKGKVTKSTVSNDSPLLPATTGMHSPSRNKTTSIGLDVGDGRTGGSSPQPYSPSRTHKHAMQLLQDESTAAKALSSLIKQDSADSVPPKPAIPLMHGASSSISSNIHDAPKSTKGIAFSNPPPISQSGFGETTVAKGKAIIKTAWDDEPTETIESRPRPSYVAQPVHDSSSISSSSYNTVKKDPVIANSRTYYDSVGSSLSASSSRADEKPTATGRVGIADASATNSDSAGKSTSKYYRDADASSRTFDVFGDDVDIIQRNSSRDAEIGAKGADDQAAKNKKITVPKSPKFSKMSWERRTADGTGGTSAPPPPPLGATDSTQQPAAGRSASASRRAAASAAPPPPEPDRAPAPAKPIPNYMRPIGESSRRLSRG